MARPPSTIANSTIRQHPERSVPDEAPEILAKGLVAHVGFVLDGRPHVLPFTYDYDPASPDRIHVHREHREVVLGGKVPNDGAAHAPTAQHHDPQEGLRKWTVAK